MLKVNCFHIQQSLFFFQSGPPPEAVKSSPALGASEKAHSRSLFSDDEDSQVHHFSVVIIHRAYSQFSDELQLVLGHIFKIKNFFAMILLVI